MDTISTTEKPQPLLAEEPIEADAVVTTEELREATPARTAEAVLQAQIEDLQAQIEQAKQAIIEQVEQARQEGHKMLTAYKTRVAARAMQEKRDRDWCDELDYVLEDLDIDLDVLKKSALVTVTFRVASLPSASAGSDWWRSSVKWNTEDNGIEDNGESLVFRMDSDHSRVSFDNVAVESVAIED